MNRVAIVTGGASGIGRAVVERLSRDGYAVAILDIDAERGRQAAAEVGTRGGPAQFFHTDVTREAQVEESFRSITSTYGRIDLLVNVAGGTSHRHTVEEFPLAHWQETIDRNLTSAFLCCRAGIGIMKRQQSGAIVSISSDIGFSGALQRGAYAAAKAGIVGLSKCLALELAPFRIRVNVVAPGRIATERVRASYSPEAWEAGNDRIPLGHPGEPEDVAEAVAFLSGEASQHMTGQTIHVNGGRIMN
jgi:NAD(P)-dependent dehydrogenase (short-subunit alcohol dehydrogenase family)